VQTAARILEGQLNGRPGEEHRLSFETLPYSALSKTYSWDQQTSDSAPTMTAISTGHKAREGMLSVDHLTPRGECNATVNRAHALKTILEHSADLGKSTGIVTTARLTHATPAALYAQMPMAHDMIGLYAAVGNGNHVPPWGGIDLLLSTNPIAIAIPGAKRPPILLDMATTTAAYGKVKMAQQRGEQMPVGWMVDKQGNPLTDPNRSSEGFLVPIGGPKGYGLALMLGLLAGTLNGAAMGKDVVDFTTDHVTPTNTGQFICALDISAFADVAEFKAEVDEIYSQMKGSKTMGGFAEVKLPGENAWGIAQERRAQGVPLPAELVKALNVLAKDVGVEGV
jgi:LDH2 family malate/lactate/ureidoglycolate dehydrogenase